MSVFLSWGSPDRALADELAGRLKNAGLSVFYSPVDQPAGPAEAGILDHIRASRVAIIMVSNESLKRNWVRDEIAWSVGAIQAKTMAQIVLVSAGKLDKKKIPDTLHTHNVFDLTDPATLEANVLRVAQEVLKAMGGRAPIVIPGAILAMTREEFETEFQPDAERYKGLFSLCASVGMNGKETRQQLKAAFLRRYGATPHDFAPFSPADDAQPAPDAENEGGKKPVKRRLIKTIVEDAVGLINKRRQAEERRIWIRWDTDIVLGEADLSDEVADERRVESSITIIDSLSMHSTAVLRGIGRTLGANEDRRRNGVIWIPPFFEKAVEVEDHIKSLTQPDVQLRAAYSAWKGAEERWVAFHTATVDSCRQWLVRALAALALPPSARNSAKEDMESRFPPGPGPSTFNLGPTQ